MARLTALMLAAIALSAGVLLVSAPVAANAGTLVLNSCSFFNDPGTAADDDGPVWQAQGPSSYNLTNGCPLGGSFRISDNGTEPAGAHAGWSTTTPPSIGITGAITPLNTVLILPNLNFEGWDASYFWDGGTQAVADGGSCCGGMDYGVGINRSDLNGSRYFGFQATCVESGGCEIYGKTELLDVSGIELFAQDTTPPSVVALGSDNLWYQTSQWVRGPWPISFQAADDSGICGMRAIVDGQSIQGPTAVPNQSSWTQCPTPQTMDQSIDTASYPDGPLTLQLSAADATSPANVSSPSETLNVDNQPITLSLGGPTDALSTAGVQYVNALASAGPSGVADIECSVDGAPYEPYAGASAQIPVQGIGQHTVSCYAQNGAIDAQGDPASSAVQTWNLGIRQPTISGISFGTRLLNAPRCHRVKRAVRCRPRVMIRKVRVRGRIRRERIVLRPHTVRLNQKRLRYGRGAAVSGWVGLADGTALAGVPVQVISATDNGLSRWRTAASASTSANGFWHAKLRPGPSRLIAAVYPGSGTTEPATSGDVRLIVRTRVLLHIRPRRERWGHTIRISGRVLGGDIPAGKLLRLRIGTADIYSTVGIPEISPNGRYRTSWTFAPGQGLVRYWFSVSTLPEADYPYSQTSSRRVYVTVDG